MRRLPLLSTAVAFLLASLLLSSPLVTAQTVPPPLAGITVLGSGRASAPAETATIVLMLGPGFYYEDPKMMEPKPDVTPAASPEETAAPVIDALVSAGVPEADIEVITNPYSGEYGPSGVPMSMVLRFDLENPTTEGISQILDAALPAAVEAGLFVNMSGVIYGVADCATLEREARVAAIADGRDQAASHAELLEVSLGDVIASRDDLYSAIYGTSGGYAPINSCTSQAVGSSISSLYSATPFDPGLPAEVTVVVNVELTFEIATDGEATPAS